MSGFDEELEIFFENESLLIFFLSWFDCLWIDEGREVWLCDLLGRGEFSGRFFREVVLEKTREEPCRAFWKELDLLLLEQGVKQVRIRCQLDSRDMREAL